MEVATTNNHNQTHHHHHHQHHQHQHHTHLVPHHSSAASSNSGGTRSPFQREVREWQRIDPETGALLSGRLEADRWINGPLNSYGKKSSSSISSNNSSSNSLTIASSGTTNSITTATMNTHRTPPPPSKISLHAIVGNNNNSHSNKTTANSIKNQLTTTTTTTATASNAMSANTTINTATPTTTWQQQLRRRSSLFEQPDLFGNNNNNVNLNSLYKSHVGVTNADDIKNTINDFVHTNIINNDDNNNNNNDDDEHRHKRQSIEPTPTQLNRQMRRDLESFRHYNNNIESMSANTHTDERNHFNHHQYQQQQHHHQRQKQTSNNDVNAENDELRLSSRQQRRQQTPPSQDNAASLQLSRSISTDDLSTDWQITDPNTGEETTSDWRRVSKLRRSFQLSNKNETNQYATPKRPIDLPMSLGNVAKIRAELENKRRQLIATTTATTTTAGTTTKDDESTDNDEISEIRPKSTKKSTFLTAETLRKIRGNLKQLSDESLYKDDLWALRKTAFEEKQLLAEQKQLSPEHKLRQLTPEQSPEIVPVKSAFQVVAQRSVSNGENKTHSLESRQKYKDTNSAEWHFRRKSYGFEKMSPPEDRAMFRMDASTDSGLGRSGELANWSPTETMPSKRSTIIQFGDIAKAQRYQSPTDSEADEYNKRHSIAVDESSYMRKTSQVHLNGNAKIEQSLTATTSTTTTNSLFQRTQQQKRVEFCKTEVHFAAESGRVNIVETDGKPPPTNNFRRRRRITAGPLQSLVKAASATTPVKQFGDDELTKHTTVLSTNVAYKATLIEATADVAPNVTVFTTKPQLQSYIQTEGGARNSYASTSGIDTTDNENDEIAAIRGILKNKPIKPKPYHLGENIAKPTDLWSGLQLKPITTPKIDDALLLAEHKNSVAERLRLAEQRPEHTMQSKPNGFSTKINVSLGDSPRQTNDADLPKSTNIMSIALHSPEAAATPSKAAAISATATIPVAKPRTLTNMGRSEQAQVQVQEQVKVQVAQTVRQLPVKSVGAPVPIKMPKDSLKIIKEARGARKLREHELSYFGVPLTKDDAYDDNTASSQATRLTERNTIEATTQQLNNDKHNEKQTTNWHSNQINTRSHLLQHSATSHETHTTKPPFDIRPAVRKSLQQRQRFDESAEEDDEHFYENITNELKPIFKVRSTTPVNECYDRKTDVQRDAMILSEMTRNADQTLKAISDGAALKDQRRRSLQRRNSKPLETIDEKIFAEKISDKCIAVNVSRGTFASEARRSSRHSTPSPNNAGRSSSQSSVECPRARSRSLSSEREYENAPIKPSRTTTTTTAATSRQQRQSVTKPRVDSRSSSLDSQQSERSQRFSSDDELPRRIRSKRTLASKSQQTLEKSPADHTKQNKIDKSRITGEKSRSATSTMRSTRTERNKCLQTEVSKKEQQQQRTTHTATALANHSQTTRPPRRAENDGHANTIRSSDRHDRSDKVRRDKDSSTLTRSVRLVRSSRTSNDNNASTHRSSRSSNDNNSSTHRSSNRSERSDREKEKLSRSSGHSSRSNKHSSHSERATLTTATPTATAAAATPTIHYTSAATRQREHRRSTSNKSDGSATNKADKQTSSKNTAELQQQLQQKQQQQHLHYHQHPMHVHKITTSATTTEKQRERSGKNRK